MENLPLEVLCKIFSYLDGPQLLDAGLVCKRWLHASGTLLEDVTLNVTPEFVPDITSGRPFVRISFWERIIDDSCVDLINRFEVLHLKFTGCSVQSPLTSVVNCDKLLTLDTKDLEVLSLFNALPSLETFYLTCHANYETLKRAEFYGPRLKSFRMFRYPESTRQEDEESESDPKRISTSTAIEEFVRSRAETLKCLQLPCYISQKAVLNISKIKNLKLESVNLSNSHKCSSVIVEFCENQPSITVLELDSVPNLSDMTVCEIFAHSPALREFSCAGCDEVNQCIIPMFARPNMLRINLRSCWGITIHSFSMAISSLACVNLRVLNLSYTQLQEKHVCALLPLIPCLDELDLSRCPLSGDGLRKASLRLTRLRKLKLDKCHGLSGRTLGHLSSLVELSLCFCIGISGEALLEGVRFQHLRRLDLYQSGASRSLASFLSKLMEQNPCLIYY